MAEMKPGIKLPPQSLTYIGIGVIVTLLFIFVGIIPANRSIAQLEAETKAVTLRIEAQRVLAPLYPILRDRSEKKESAFLPMPVMGRLSKSEIRAIPLSFGAAAKKSGMSLVSAIPEMNAMIGDAQSLTVNIILRGNFMDFRKFLINMGGLPYVQHIEEISIQQIPDTREFKLKIWVAFG